MDKEKLYLKFQDTMILSAQQISVSLLAVKDGTLI